MIDFYFITTIEIYVLYHNWRISTVLFFVSYKIIQSCYHNIGCSCCYRSSVTWNTLYLIIMIISQVILHIFIYKAHIFIFVPYQIMTLANKSLRVSKKINTKQLENRDCDMKYNFLTTTTTTCIYNATTTTTMNKQKKITNCVCVIWEPEEY